MESTFQDDFTSTGGSRTHFMAYASPVYSRHAQVFLRGPTWRTGILDTSSMFWERSDGLVKAAETTLTPFTVDGPQGHPSGSTKILSCIHKMRDFCLVPGRMPSRDSHLLRPRNRIIRRRGIPYLQHNTADTLLYMHDLPHRSTSQINFLHECIDAASNSKV